MTGSVLGLMFGLGHAQVQAGHLPALALDPQGRVPLPAVRVGGQVGEHILLAPPLRILLSDLRGRKAEGQAPAPAVPGPDRGHPKPVADRVRAQPDRPVAAAAQSLGHGCNPG